MTGICLYFVTAARTDVAHTTPNLVNINGMAEQPEWNRSCQHLGMVQSRAWRGEVGEENMFATIIGNRVYVRLSRRNLRQLDAALDDPASRHGWLSRRAENGVSLVVQVEDDSEHYGGREVDPGRLRTPHPR